jgi:transglutaminase-like putative cysteine protease
MNVKNTFSKLVLVQVLLGIVSFSLATHNPMLLIIGGLLTAVAWYLVESPGGKPLPQWAINIAAVAAIVWLLYELLWDRSRMALPMGRFTVCVQVAVLFGPKRYREYALVLVLSLIQVIGASIVSESMIFAGMLVLYSVVMLFTILMLHLSTTADRVSQANQAAAPASVKHQQMPGCVGQGYRWHFRFTAVFVGAACAITAAVVFVTMPRSDLPDLRRQITSIGLGRQVGFSETVSLHGAPTGGGSDEIVMALTMKYRGKHVGGPGRSWLVRGAALDQYDQGRRIWRRSEMISSMDDPNIPINQIMRSFAKLPGNEPYWEAQITQRLKNTNMLFSLHPVSSMSSPSLRSVRFNAIDQQLSSNTPLRGVNLYIQHIPTKPIKDHFDAYFKRSGARLSPDTYLKGQYMFSVGPKHRQIGAEARRILREADIDGAKKFTDLQKIRTLASYLRNNYLYDLTNDHFGLRQDPTSEFLLRTKRGHCEMFASAIASMAREIGLPSRVITGFRATEYNKVGKYYTVRQSDAHAWAEVYCKQSGWVTIDATPSRSVATEHAAPRHWYTSFLETYEHLELSWVQSFVSYDRGRRERIMESLQIGFSQVADGFIAMLNDQTTLTGKIVAILKVFKEQWGMGWLTYAMIILILLNIVVMAMILMHKLAVRWGLIDKVGLLVHRSGRGKANQIRFYFVMSNLLARHGQQRTASQSPMQFAHQLVRLDPTRYGTVMSLTELYYEIRFGQRKLNAPRRQRANNLLQQLKQAVIRTA